MDSILKTELVSVRFSKGELREIDGIVEKMGIRRGAFIRKSVKTVILLGKFKYDLEQLEILCTVLSKIQEMFND